jgi:hypothetical protein
LKNAVTSAYLLSDPRRKSLPARHLNDSDVVIRLPLTAPDASDSVVVVEVDGPINANPTRLLAVNQANVLRVFDGELHGAGLRYGDGKSFRAYVFEWRNLSEWIGWRVRLNSPGEFELAVKYTTHSQDNVGRYEVAIGEQQVQATVQPTPNENESTTVALGRVRLGPGNHEIIVRPVDIKGGELMRLFYVSLTPVAGK